MKNSISSVVTNGIFKNNATFRLVLGTCPTLAVTVSALNGLSMGLATTFVLVCSNFIISLLRRVIPNKVRIPAYVLVIATFVTVVQMVMQKFMPDLNDSLGLFIPLIVVNCIILARAESFAAKNNPLMSVLDGIGTGLGFTMSLTLIGVVREFLGSAAFFGMTIPFLYPLAMTIFILPAGGFFVFGFLMVAYNLILNNIERANERRRLKKLPLTVSEEIAK